MNKISMDALNSGWAIGFGTRIPQQSEDEGFASHRSRTVSGAGQDRAPGPVLTFISAMAVLSLAALHILPQRARRAAHRPT